MIKNILWLKNVIVFLVCLFVSASAQKIFADAKNYNSYVRVTYNKENGLLGGKANDIASTKDGILWIGTYEGLYRHNGYEFRLMNEFESIKAVRCLYLDDDGRLFVGTNDNGLSIMIDEAVERVIDGKDGLPSDSIRSVIRGADGLYYIGTSEALAVFSIDETNAPKFIKTIPQINNAIRLSADKDGHVAVVTYDGRLFVLKDSQVIWSSEKTGEHFSAAKLSNDGVLYAATENNKIKVLSVDDENGSDAVFLKSSDSFMYAYLQHINSIDFYDGVLFLCADNGIVYISDGIFYEIETGAFNNSIENMMQDYQGNLWFSSSRLGLFKLCWSSFSEIYASAGLKEDVVNSIASFDGDLYFATDSGLMAVDAKTGREMESNVTYEFASTRVRCLTVTRDGKMWICAKSKGLICVDKKGSMEVFGSGHNFRMAIELSDGTIAAGGTDGVVFIKDGKIISWLGSDDGLENPLILTLSETVEGAVLAGTDGGGLAIIAKSNAGFAADSERWELVRLIKRADGLSSNVVLRTVNDYDGDKPTGGVFAVLSNGLCYLEPKKDSMNIAAGRSSNVVTEYSIKYLSNFPFFNNYDIVIRENRNIFVLSSAGIFVVDRDELISGEKLDYELLDLKKGLRGSLTVNSWNYIDDEGNLYLSCDSGASKINLNTYDKIGHSFRVQLKSIIVDEKRYRVQSDVPFIIPAESEKVEILPEIINFSINNPYISLYMEGVNESPSVMLQSEISSLIYTNLKAGTYKFHIAVLDSKGVNEVDEAVYTITKLYSIYEKLGFRLCSAIGFVLIIAGLTWYITIMLLRKKVEKIEKQVRMGNETIFAIANAVEARDKSTGRHSSRVAEYSVMIARELGFSEKQLDSLHKTGILHDIGKIGVPDSILNKPARLTDEEYGIMKTHVEIGGEILKEFTLIDHVADGAKFHHEHYDGTGYPNGLRGDEIPLNARIIGIADAFDAMTANRVYRNAMQMDYVISELKRCSGTQFDPALVRIMLDLIETGKIKGKNF